MLNPKHPLTELLERDTRYHFDAYVFVFDALGFAQKSSNLGTHCGAESETEADSEDRIDDSQEENHITGQQLCEAIRRYAIQQYGMMAKSVLNHWGVSSTADFGEIVFNLIDIGQMRKNDNDCREDFLDVFDFTSGLRDTFALISTDSSEERWS